MYYYKRNIGDYHKKAGRLTMLQHGAYSLLMDSIYDREEFPTMDDAIDWAWASSKDEIEAVEFVLRKFFKLKDGLYLQKRMTQEIEEYTGVCSSNAINGKKGGRPKGAKNKPKKTQPVNIKTHSVNIKTQINPSESELKPNQEPLTTNQEPVTINQEPSGSSDRLESDSDTSLNTMSDLQNYDQMILDENVLVSIETGECKTPFERFWDAYGKKEKRIPCEKKWKTKKLDLMIDHLLADIANRDANCHKWRIENGVRQFKSGPLAYLNGELWNDDIQPYPMGGQKVTQQEKQQAEADEWANFEKQHGSTGSNGDIQGEYHEIN